MPAFMLLFVGLAAQPAASDDQTRDYNREWGEYMGRLARDGRLRAGAPFAPSGKVVRGDSVNDLDLKQVDIGGFLLLDAESEDAALEVARRAPHIALGGTTIVRPCLDVGAPPSGA